MQSQAGAQADTMRSSPKEVGSCAPDSTGSGDGDSRRALRRAAGGSDPSKLAELLEANEWDGHAIDKTADSSGIDSNCSGFAPPLMSHRWCSAFDVHWRDDIVATTKSYPCRV